MQLSTALKKNLEKTNPKTRYVCFFSIFFFSEFVKAESKKGDLHNDFSFLNFC